MAQRITINQTKGTLGAGNLVVVTDRTGFISKTAGSVPGVSRANTAGETIQSMTIVGAVWTCNAATGDWTISRGANTVFKLQGQSGEIDFATSNIRLEAGNEATCNIVFTSSDNPGHNWLALKIRKQSAGT